VWLLDFPGVGLIEEWSETQVHTAIPKLTILSMGGFKEKSLSKS